MAANISLGIAASMSDRKAGWDLKMIESTQNCTWPNRATPEMELKHLSLWKVSPEPGLSSSTVPSWFDFIHCFIPGTKTDKAAQ
jgi:hypothetical protein